MKVKLCFFFVLGAFLLMAAGLSAHSVFAANQDDSEFDWGGFYAGIHFGYGWGDADTDTTPLPSGPIFINLAPTTVSPDPGGVFGGAQVGFNWQRKFLVLGIETDFSGSDISGTEVVRPFREYDGDIWDGSITSHQDTDWIGTLRLRAGVVPIPRLLIYVTGGMAYGHVNYAAQADFRPDGTIRYPASFSETKVGWTAGAGAEFALSKRWSVKAEYLYYDLGTESKTANPIPDHPPYQVAYKWNTAAHTVRAGLNFRF